MKRLKTAEGKLELSNARAETGEAAKAKLISSQRLTTRAATRAAQPIQQCDEGEAWTDLDRLS